MAAPMRDSPLDGGHRAKVADPRTAAAAAAAAASNFEYDDNEWDIGIGDLIIDLDADIEKTNEKAAGGMSSSAANSGGGGKGAKMAVEHSATVDKGLKMKIKRTKPGTKTSEAKHEIVKTGEQNGAGDGGGKHAATSAGAASGAGGAASTLGGSSKRGSSGHRRDKARDKHGEKGAQQKPPQTPSTAPTPPPSVTAPPDVNGVVVRQNSAPPPSPVAASATVVPVVSQQQTTAATSTAPPPTSSQQSHHHQPPQQQPPPQAPPPRVVFPVAAGPGPGPPLMSATPNAPGPPQAVVASAASQAGTAAVPSAAALVSVKVEAYKGAAPSQVDSMDDSASMSPPAKKLKSEPKDMLDVCVGTSVGTITEPDCLGPCEPGTSVTLEGIVWHETEGGVLVVNVTWRGKTYVGTLLDCTRHDWAPPRFCDSPTSDLDARLPKGRGKRGRAAASTTPGSDLSNFTETRSSVHSKLRNGGAKGRRGGSTGSGPSSGTTAGTGSPTPFVSPRPETNNKRKGRSPEEESPSSSKKNRAPQPPTPSGGGGSSSSPPSSPVLLECPEPNCSKKYKHINGLKYHQSHAHGSAEDEDTKDAASTSENDESNAEAPSPAPSLKSPEKGTAPEPRKDELSNGAVASQGGTVSPPAVVHPEPPSQPPTPPQELVTPPAPPVGAAPSPDPKSLVKPGVLRFGPPVEDFSVGVFCNNKPATLGSGAVSGGSSAPVSTIRAVNVAVAPGQTPPPQVQQQQAPPSQVQQVPPTQVHQQPLPVSKPPQFKVKPTASLMPDDKKDRNKLTGHKKKNRKSPAGSPHPQPEQPTFGLDAASGREDVQSPAYSDISDDAAPVLESEVGSDGKAKGQGPDKKGDAVVGGQGPSPHSIPPYGMYPFFSQPPYLVPSVQQDSKAKESVGVVDKHAESKVCGEKEKKDVSASANEYSQKLLQQHYYPYGYVPGYGYNLEPNYPMAVMPSEDKVKDSPGKDDKSPSPVDHGKASLPTAPSPIQVPNPAKIKAEAGVGIKEKHQNDNHQILKESIEMKNQMNSYVYSRQQQQQQQQEELRRYYLYPEQQRRKDPGSGAEMTKASGPPQKQTLPSPGHKHKDKGHGDDKKEDKVKQEGVKPTMETQGPPPPPTSSYAYIHHPGYMQAPPYGALPFDPGHAVYRSVLVPGYGAAPYLHPPLSRYPHAAPEDLSRPPPSAPTKALDLLQHHASQYYSSHKIHELQERALKSPTPKGVSGGGPGAAVSSASPSGVVGGGGPSPGHGQQQQSGGPSVGASSGVGGGGPNVVQASGKQQASSGEGKEARSPPPQRHVHTHHHTHVGLGYPILASQYPAPYGAAVLASQQAAAVAATVINPYPPK